MSHWSLMIQVRRCFEAFQTAEVGVQAAASAAVLLTWFFGCKACLAARTGKPVEPRQSAWLLSFFVAVFCMPWGIIYGLDVLKPGWSAAVMLEEDATSRALLVFFLVYLMIDTCLGYLEYRSEFGLLSGWIHHFFYIAFLTHAYVRGYTVSFAYTLLMESSTIFLAGGRLFKALRQDLLFGVLFFLSRVCYHGYLLWHLYSLPKPRVAIWRPVLGVWVLHLYWLSQWVKSQQRRMARAKAAKKLE